MRENLNVMVSLRTSQDEGLTNSYKFIVSGNMQLVWVYVGVCGCLSGAQYEITLGVLVLGAFQ